MRDQGGLEGPKGPDGTKGLMSRSYKRFGKSRVCESPGVPKGSVSTRRSRSSGRSEVWEV